MKKVISTFLLISIVAVPCVYAQMGEAMKSGQGNRGHMEGQMNQQQMDRMLSGHEVTGDMMHHMGHMTRLMQQMRDMMAEKTDSESMRQISVLMEDMSEHLVDMSRVMSKGNASQKDMQDLDQQNMRMQKKYEMMRW